MARPDKAAAVAELTEQFRSSHAAVLTEYRGLTVTQLKELRRSLGETTNYAVVKNTLTRIAAKQAGVDAFDDLLQGPSAIAFVTGDPVEAAKGLRDFSRAHPLLVIKGGVLDGKPLTADEIRTIADLESREVLLAKLAGAMQASLQGAVSLFAAPLSQAARVMDALRQKAEADPSVLAGSGTPGAADTGGADAAPEAGGADAAPEAGGADTAAEAPAEGADTAVPDQAVGTSEDPATPAQPDAAEGGEDAVPDQAVTTSEA